MAPALRLIDIMCTLEKDEAKREAIRKAATEYYDNREQRMGESLVAQGVVSPEFLKLALLTQRAELGRLTAADKEELWRLQSDMHDRAMASLEEMRLIAQQMRGDKP
jgi:hypothetical protein